MVLPSLYSCPRPAWAYIVWYLYLEWKASEWFFGNPSLCKGVSTVEIFLYKRTRLDGQVSICWCKCRGQRSLGSVDCGSEAEVDSLLREKRMFPTEISLAGGANGAPKPAVKRAPSKQLRNRSKSLSPKNLNPNRSNVLQSLNGHLLRPGTGFHGSSKAEGVNDRDLPVGHFGGCRLAFGSRPWCFAAAGKEPNDALCPCRYERINQCGFHFC